MRLLDTASIDKNGFEKYEFKQTISEGSVVGKHG